MAILPTVVLVYHTGDITEPKDIQKVGNTEASQA
jgi:hypothetical protein